MPVGTVQWAVSIKERIQLMLIKISGNTGAMEVTFLCIVVVRAMTLCSMVEVMDLQKTHCLHVVPQNNLVENKN